jgi:uncharacterized spore protein YtfJ
MSIDRLFDTIERTRDSAQWRVAFGEPQVVDDRTIIPVAKAGYAFGLGFGKGMPPAGEEADESTPEAEWSSAGGGAQTKPLGVIVATPERVYFESTIDAGKISLAGLAVGALSVLQVFKTLREIFGRR